MFRTRRKRMQTQTKLLGDFQIESGKVIVSDPCYEVDFEINETIENVKNGKWIAKIETKKVWGERVSKLMCCHESVYQFSRSLIFKVVSKDIGVDSGQAGIFDVEHFKKDSDVEDLPREYKEKICENEPWYSYCCDRTLSKMADVIPFGVVSSSGLGDGCYVCEVAKKENEVVAMQVTFLEEEHDEGEEEEE